MLVLMGVTRSRPLMLAPLWLRLTEYCPQAQYEALSASVVAFGPHRLRHRFRADARLPLCHGVGENCWR